MPFDGAPLRPGDYPALALNADFQPLSIQPMSVWNWQDAVHAVVKDRVSVLAEYDRMIRSQRLELRLPKVIVLREYVSLETPAALTRFNLLLRDGHRCQYCGEPFAEIDLTFDHVLPRSRGGVTSFENCVAACEACNGRKKNRTPAEAGMPLLRPPHHPTKGELNRCGMATEAWKRLHDEFLSALYWDAELLP